MTIKVRVDANDKLNVELSKPTSVQDILSTLLCGCLATLRSVVDKAREEEGEEVALQVRDEMYDIFNTGASNILEAFAPDKELRPDITAEALLELENSYIEKKAAEINGK